MKRITWMGVLVAGALSSGCLPNNFVAPDKPPAKTTEPARPAERPPVVAAQIDSANAREKAQALRDELDRDLERAQDTGDPNPPKK